MIQIKWSSVILMIVILSAAGVLSHIADVWTVPMQNDTTMAQLNGGDTDMVIMNSTNSMLSSIRISIFPIAIALCMLIVALEVKRILKLNKEKEEEKKTDN